MTAPLQGVEGCHECSGMQPQPLKYFDPLRSAQQPVSGQTAHTRACGNVLAAYSIGPGTIQTMQLICHQPHTSGSTDAAREVPSDLCCKQGSSRR